MAIKCRKRIMKEWLEEELKKKKGEDNDTERKMKRRRNK